jgi:hypothetical protein
VAERPELMQDDGIHPTAEAQPIILDNVWPKLVPLLPGQTQAASGGASDSSQGHSNLNVLEYRRIATISNSQSPHRKGAR